MDMLEAMQRLEAGIRTDGRYPPAAFEFLHRGVQHSSERVHGPVQSDKPRHVSGKQLCEGLRELAVNQWGPLAPLVLSTWNIRETRDFGEMVFLLSELGVLSLQAEDKRSDFDNVYDFRDAFSRYEIPTDAIVEEQVCADGANPVIDA